MSQQSQKLVERVLELQVEDARHKRQDPVLMEKFYQIEASSAGGGP